MVLRLEKITIKYGDLTIFENFSLEIPEQKVTCILGPSGCGKTTLLSIIGRILQPNHGHLIDFENKTISYLFQDLRLLDWKTVSGNLDFVLKDIYPDEERAKKINYYLKMVGLLKFRDYYPKSLSGGMKQRLAIARAFAYPSNILLMDEPFKALDLLLKMTLINDFVQLWLNDLRTVVFVTHDIEEALLAADQIYLFSKPPVRIIKALSLNIPRKGRTSQETCFVALKQELYHTIMLGENDTISVLP
ncbi:MAG: ABC transporter ATP-binding protein [Dethiobacter sp.]|jgi:NitT/TauT family transport system ATP-binding protein|nr:ABC transporter ATP-binding protein [Dethiobacter sp.]